MRAHEKRAASNRARVCMNSIPYHQWSMSPSYLSSSFACTSTSFRLSILHCPIGVERIQQREPSHGQRHQQGTASNCSQHSPQHSETVRKGDHDLVLDIDRERGYLWDEGIRYGSPLWYRLDKQCGKFLCELVLKDSAPDGNAPHLQRMKSNPRRKL